MKRMISLLLAFVLSVALCGCQGNFGSVDLNDPITIPEDGSIDAAVIQAIRDKNAIGIFQGSSGDVRYEWTVFGSDIQEVKSVNLAATVTCGEAVEVQLMTREAFGFTALLSVYLNEKWTAQSATGYAGEQPAMSVSLTGSKATILNMVADGSISRLTVRPDALLEDAIVDTQPTQAATQPAREQDDYLSGGQSGNDQTYTGGNEGSAQEGQSQPTTGKDGYLSQGTAGSGEIYTGTPIQGSTEPSAPQEKDQYLTDPVPDGKPQPVEPEDQNVNGEKTYTCTFSIECATILNNLDMLDPEKLEMVPSGGVILPSTTVTFYEGESVFDVLQRLCKEQGIHMEASWTPIYNSAYVEGIHNLYEFDCGALSGWMYKVNGWYPNYGCSRYQLKDGDVVDWRYTCDLGVDVGGAYAVGG